MEKKEKEEKSKEKKSNLWSWICYGMMFGAVIGMSLTIAKDKFIYQIGGIIVGVIVGLIIWFTKKGNNKN